METAGAKGYTASSWRQYFDCLLCCCTDDSSNSSVAISSTWAREGMFVCFISRPWTNLRITRITWTEHYTVFCVWQISELVYSFMIHSSLLPVPNAFLCAPRGVTDDRKLRHVSPLQQWRREAFVSLGHKWGAITSKRARCSGSQPRAQQNIMLHGGGCGMNSTFPQRRSGVLPRKFFWKFAFKILP